MSHGSSDVCSSDLTVALEHALGQVRHHDRREDLQQLVRLAALQAGGLGDAGLRALLLAAEDVAKDAGAVGLAVLRAAEHRAEHAADVAAGVILLQRRSEEHTSELQSLMRSSYAVFCLKKKNIQITKATQPLAR